MRMNVKNRNVRRGRDQILSMKKMMPILDKKNPTWLELMKVTNSVVCSSIVVHMLSKTLLTEET